MGSDFPIFEIVIFGMIAAFLVLRLKNTLGKRTGHEQEQPRGRFGFAHGAGEKGEQRADDNVVAIPGRDKAPGPVAMDLEPDEDASPLEKGLFAIGRADPNFDRAGFAEGARGAYEMIVQAFAAGDTATLRPLLADKVLASFSGAIDERARRGETVETRLVGFRSADIIEADLVGGRTAEVTVRFVVEMISVTRDSEDRVIAGDPNQVATVTDIWTFARDTRSRDPNWELIATRSAH